MFLINWNEFLRPYNLAVSELELKFKNIAENYGPSDGHCPIEYVEGRVKSIGSILGKASRKGVSLEDIENRIEDIAGVRIICRFVEDIERVTDIIRSRQDFDLTILKERDYITNTKPSGYRSFHVIVNYPVAGVKDIKNVKAEIQIRTMSMNFWATIEHSMRYKYSGDVPEHVQERLISSAEAAFKLDQEMSLIRDEIVEAQKVSRIINETINEILKNLQRLHTVAKIESVNDLHREFFDIYSLNDMEKLLKFAEKVRIIGDMYKVRF